MPFTFSWTGTGLDEEVFGFELQQSEGEFATLRVEIRNPRAGLLRPGAPLWGELGKDGQLLFRGRIVGLPESIAEDVVSLSFIARPDAFEALKAAAAEGLKVAPYWDPVWITAERRGDPDTALEARPALWHIDRVTHAVSVSDIIAGEAGLVTFTGEDILADSVHMQFAATPVARVSCSATVQWEESGAGTLNLSGRIGTIKTLTGQGLLESWPKRGAQIGGGWFVSEASGERLDGGAVQSQLFAIATEDGASYGLPIWTIKPHFVAGWSIARQRTETVTFTLDAGVQAIVSDSSEDGLLTVAMTSGEVDQPIDAGGALPIGDLRRKSYFTTDRGRRSLEYLIQLCRARLLARARAVNVSWQCSIDQAAALTLRHSARIIDPRLPGGQATGKVVGLRLSASGDSGEALGEVTIACTAGLGGTVEPPAGASDYAAGYSTGYTKETGAYLVDGGAGDVAWQWGPYTIADDGVDLQQLTPARVVQQVTISNPASAQQAALLAAPRADISAALAVLGEAYTEVALELLPLAGGPFDSVLPVICSPLAIPRTIDLEAA